ncbi:MAG: SDR family oxidoreductase [Myxococcota bacterium]
MSEGAGAPLLVTGANGHLGRRLIVRLAGQRAVRAVVRSERAAAVLLSLPDAIRPEIRILSYTDEDALAEAASDCAACVHLVGIIKEGRGATYASAHEDTCRVLARAAERAGLQRLVYLSILGSHPDAANACLASKGRAESLLGEGPTPVTTLRVPMVLGEGDFASRALAGQARAPFLFLIAGGRTWQQPIDAADVVEAIVLSLARSEPGNEAFDLGGPEPLRHRELVERAAALYGRRPRVVPVPLGLARSAIGLLSRVASNPPITPAMLGVLQHNDRIDPRPACDELGLSLTPLDETLARCVGPDARDDLPTEAT